MARTPANDSQNTTPSSSTPAPAPATSPLKGYLYFVFPSGCSIEPESVQLVKDQIKNSTVDELNLIINSSGGDMYSAVRIIRILRNKFKKIKGLVPFRAMSAATLMLLGTSEIYMSEESQLGPLDLLIEHPTDGSSISSLDMVNTVNQISYTAFSQAKDMYDELRDLPKGERIGKNEAMKMALTAAVETIKPIVSKIDPYLRQKAFRKLKIGEYYARDLLKTGMFKNNTYQAGLSALMFVHSFPDHGYAIFKEEASNALKLAIKNSTDYTDWDSECTLVESYMEKKTAQVFYEER